MPGIRDLIQLDDAMAARFPRDVVLAEHEPLTVTPLVPSDWQMLEAFLRAIPAEEHRFFRHELSDPERVRRWCRELDYAHMLPLLAWEGEQIVADAALQREPGLWTAHIGKLRLLVHPDFRRHGLGRAMVHEIIDVAKILGLHKLVHECAAEQKDLIGMLGTMGFGNVAMMREFIRDRDGRLHDMVVMAIDLN